MIHIIEIYSVGREGFGLAFGAFSYI